MTGHYRLRWLAMRRRHPGSLLRVTTVLLLALLHSVGAHAADPAVDEAPWGNASLDERTYAPQRVLYDVSSKSLASFERVLDRVSYLNTLYNADPFAASIVVVLHGDEIDYFAIDNYSKHGELMQRARSLSLSGPIHFRMCRVAARERGYDLKDIHGFVTMVPMADAEIVRLQQEEGYVYMQ